MDATTVHPGVKAAALLAVSLSYATFVSDFCNRAQAGFAAPVGRGAWRQHEINADEAR